MIFCFQAVRCFAQQFIDKGKSQIFFEHNKFFFAFTEDQFPVMFLESIKGNIMPPTSIISLWLNIPGSIFYSA